MTFDDTHTRLTALFLELSRWAGTRKVKPIWMPSYQLNKKTVNTLKLKTLSPADTQPTGLSWATNWLLSLGMMAAWRPVQAVRKRVSLTYRGWSVERAVKQLVDSGRLAAADWSPTARLGLRSHMQTHSTGWWCRTAVMLSVYKTRYFSPAWLVLRWLTVFRWAYHLSVLPAN